MQGLKSLNFTAFVRLSNIKLFFLTLKNISNYGSASEFFIFECLRLNHSLHHETINIMRHPSKAWLGLALSGCLLAVSGAQAQSADTYPNRTVTIVVPYPAGGTADVLPRLVAERLAERWGQAVVVENRTGAGGNIGADYVARAPADGYTLMATPPAPLVVNHNLYTNLSYDPTAFVPITTLASAANVLAVRKDFPAADAAAFIAYAKNNPGKITVATQGNGTTSHLTGAMFAGAADTEFVFIPYRGTAPAMTDLLGGQVDVFFDNLGSMYAQHQNGLARILAVATRDRSALLPDVPALAEAGLEGFHSSTWFGLAAPAGTPDDIADKIQAEVSAILKSPEIQARFLKQGVVAVGDERAEFAAFMAEERQRWKEVIDNNNVTVN